MKFGPGVFAVWPKSAKIDVTGLALGCFMTFSGVAFADPVALVLDKSDAVAFPAFSELSPGDVVELGNTGFIDLLDYKACREVRITSGIVTFSSDGYLLDGGEEKELRAGNCLKAGAAPETTTAEKGLTVTLRSIKPENKVAASLMLRFDSDLQQKFDSVIVSIDGDEPKQFDMGDNVLAEMPPRDTEADSVGIELLLQGTSGDEEAVTRKFTIDPEKVGRKTAVVIVE